MITEGMRPLDLENQVRALISVNEFESKLSNTAIVFAFYCSSSDAARDFRRFVHKSSVEILDSEQSDAPDALGRYLVFVELTNDIRLGDKVNILLREIKSVTGIDRWAVRISGKTTTVDYDKIQPTIAQIQVSEISESFGVISDSLMGVIPGTQLRYIDWGAVERVCERNSLGISHSNSYEETVSISKVQDMVNEHTVVAPSDSGILLVNETTGFSALLGQ